MVRKPEGHDEMTELLGKLVKVPKKELDQQLHIITKDFSGLDTRDRVRYVLATRDKE